MRRTNENLLLCGMLFAVALVISNVVASKTIYTGIPLFGSTILLPGSALCYAITFLMTDVVGELWGRKQARNIVVFGFMGQLLATGLIMLVQYLPAGDAAMQASYEMLLGQSVVFFAASMTAYACSQSWDVFVFHKIRDHVLSVHPGDYARRWTWNCGSTMTSQIIDTVLFVGIGFGLGSGWLLNLETLPQLAAMMVGHYLVKFCLAALDTPFFYLLTHRRPADTSETDAHDCIA